MPRIITRPLENLPQLIIDALKKIRVSHRHFQRWRGRISPCIRYWRTTVSFWLNVTAVKVKKSVWRKLIYPSWLFFWIPYLRKLSNDAMSSFLPSIVIRHLISAHIAHPVMRACHQAYDADFILNVSDRCSHFFFLLNPTRPDVCSLQRGYFQHLRQTMWGLRSLANLMSDLLYSQALYILNWLTCAIAAKLSKFQRPSRKAESSW